ncbi:DUF4192 family protein [Micromonospora sp. NPDC050686]|uniref:DUF4192 family protein n=1 Tax=Micromonospora sp. NPDC050686 TaxID=3154631 RepID=UPI0033F4DDAF
MALLAEQTPPSASPGRRRDWLRAPGQRRGPLPLGRRPSRDDRLLRPGATTQPGCRRKPFSLTDHVPATGRTAPQTIGWREGSKGPLARYADEQTLTDDELAWLTVLLPAPAIRDAAWRATDDQPWHTAMWADITRPAHPPLAAPPASLLAFAAWRRGEGALASVAVDRALAANPGYPLARLIDQALRAGLPPSVLDGWPHPDQPTH